MAKTKGDAQERIAAIRALFEALAELGPYFGQQPAKPLTEKQVGAFEQKHGIALPAGYRAYLVEVGNGGAGFPSGGLKKLAASKRMTSQFPLDGPWADHDPELVAEARAAGDDEIESIPIAWGGKLPKGAKPDDGCLSLGGADDGANYLLVIAGPHAGEVWIDGRGSGPDPVYPAALDALDDRARWEEVPPSESQFLAVQERWLEGQLASARMRACFDEGIRNGTLGALVEASRGKERVELLALRMRHAQGRLRAELKREKPDAAACAELAEQILAAAPEEPSDCWLAWSGLALAGQPARALELALAAHVPLAKQPGNLNRDRVTDSYILQLEALLGRKVSAIAGDVNAELGAHDLALARVLEAQGALERLRHIAPASLALLVRDLLRRARGEEARAELVHRGEKGSPDVTGIASVVRDDSGTQWVGGELGTLARSTDGASWSPVAVPVKHVKSLRCFAGLAYVVGGDAIYELGERGVGRKLAPGLGELADFVRTGAGYLVAVGPKALVAFSSDGGSTWRRLLQVPTQADLTKIAAIDEATLVAIGPKAPLLVSYNGGFSFDRVAASGEFQSVAAFPGGAYVGASEGRVFRLLAPGGAPWKPTQTVKLEGGPPDRPAGR